VECGEPYDVSKLPPEYPITENADMKKAWEKTSELVSRRLAEAGLAGQQMSLDDCIRQMMKGEPTLEWFKAQLIKT